MLKCARVPGGKKRITFTLDAAEPDGPVSVVGDFNDWEPGRHELKSRRNGTRSVSVILAPGVHRFRYLATGGVWLDDETADQVDHDGSVVNV